MREGLELLYTVWEITTEVGHTMRAKMVGRHPVGNPQTGPHSNIKEKLKTHKVGYVDAVITIIYDAIKIWI